MMFLYTKLGQTCQYLIAFFALSFCVINANASSSRTQHTASATEAEAHRQSASSEAEARCQSDPKCTSTLVQGHRLPNYGVQPVSISQAGINALTEGGSLGNGGANATPGGVGGGSSGNTSDTEEEDEKDKEKEEEDEDEEKEKEEECKENVGIAHSFCLSAAQNGHAENMKSCVVYSAIPLIGSSVGGACIEQRKADLKSDIADCDAVQKYNAARCSR